MYMSKRSLVMGILLIVAAPAWCKDYTVAVGVADFDPVEAFNFSPNHLPNQTGDVVQPGDTITFVNAFNDGFHNAHSLDSAFPFQCGSNGCTNSTPAGGLWTATVTVPASAAGKTINYQCDAHFTLGMVGSITIAAPTPVRLQSFDVK